MTVLVNILGAILLAALVWRAMAVVGRPDQRHEENGDD